MKVCRTCLQVLASEAGCLSVDTDDCSLESPPSIRSKLLLCVPELVVDVVQGAAVICGACSDALNTAYDFKNKCLQTEQRILNFAQFTGCSTDSVNINEVVQLRDLNGECDPVEIRQQLAEVHYPITQIIEHDSELDIKPVILSCDTPDGGQSSPASIFYYEPDMQAIKVEADLEQVKVVNNGTEHKLPAQVFFSPELDVEVRSYGADGMDFFTLNSLDSTTGVGQSHQCMYCPKSFALMGELESHLMTHVERRPLQCTMCERRFVRKDKLMLHMRIHTGEKPFECTLCGRCFSRKDKLNNHMRTHTGEKPHQCILCQKSFARKDKMNTHMRSQHWLALANLEITVVKNAGLTNAASETEVSENAPSQ